MPDAPAETATPENVPTPEPEVVDTVDLAAELDKWKANARKNEERAKANATAAKELEQLKATMMTDQERAINEARQSARAEALAEASAEVVRAKIAAAAAGRMTEAQLEALTATVDTGKFLGEDGKVDPTLITGFVEGIAPPQPTAPQVPDFGQGARNAQQAGAPPALNSDALLESLKAAVGAG